jgi:hypothetical protein
MIQSSETLSLPHFTVKEYLQSCEDEKNVCDRYLPPKAAKVEQNEEQYQQNINKNKAINYDLANHLNSPKAPKVKEDCFLVNLNHKIPPQERTVTRVSLSNLSSPDLTRYRLLLEASYLNPANDTFYRDGMPQRFRDGTHTFEEMQTALENFIGKLQQGNSPVLEKGSRLPSELPLLTGNLDKHSLAVTRFIKARDSLPEYQAWEKMCKLLTENPQDEQVKKACSLASEAFLKACKALPEWLPFWEAKIDQYLEGQKL